MRTKVSLFIVVALAGLLSAGWLWAGSAPIAGDGPISLEGGAYTAAETPPEESEICLQANAVHQRVCPIAKVACPAILAEADAELIDQITRCPITEVPWDYRPGKTLVGYVPCCVMMGGGAQE